MAPRSDLLEVRGHGANGHLRRLPMIIRAVDYFYPGGGRARFVAETLSALSARPGITVELVSHGAALDGYRDLLTAIDTPIRLLDIRPANYWATRSPGEIQRIYGIKGTYRLRRAMGHGREETFFAIPRAAFKGAAAVWLPWAHRHRVPEGLDPRVLATLHDLILIEHADLLRGFTRPESVLPEERETAELLVRSRATIVITSEATRSSLVRLFSCDPTRFELVRVLTAHDRTSDEADIPAEWDWASSPFLLCPANFSPHKNHEVLLTGVGAWSGHHPLVLSGLAADLPLDTQRGRELRAIAERAGLAVGALLHPLGYIGDELYLRLLKQSWALIMPTLAEGGGSYPVLEAMLHGVPVICSDIPVMREQMARTGGEVLWFDPTSPLDLARRLAELEGEYARYKARAVAQATALHTESQKDVAARYAGLLAGVAGSRS